MTAYGPGPGCPAEQGMAVFDALSWSGPAWSYEPPAPSMPWLSLVAFPPEGTSRADTLRAISGVLDSCSPGVERMSLVLDTLSPGSLPAGFAGILPELGHPELLSWTEMETTRWGGFCRPGLSLSRGTESTSLGMPGELPFVEAQVSFYDTGSGSPCLAILHVKEDASWVMAVGGPRALSVAAVLGLAGRVLAGQSPDGLARALSAEPLPVSR